MKRLIVLMAVAAVAACQGTDQKTVGNTPAVATTQSKNSDEFNRSFSPALESYYKLKDALVATNDSLASKAAQELEASANGIKFEALKENSIATKAKGYAKTISNGAKTLAGEKNIDAKRKSFETISDNMYNLLRTVQYDREIVYHQFCPMAFNDAGAYWLSKSDEIKNPYFGKKMLTCGEVKDELNFMGK